MVVVDRSMLLLPFHYFVAIEKLMKTILPAFQPFRVTRFFLTFFIHLLIFLPKIKIDAPLVVYPDRDLTLKVVSDLI